MNTHPLLRSLLIAGALVLCTAVPVYAQETQPPPAAEAPAPAEAAEPADAPVAPEAAEDAPPAQDAAPEEDAAPEYVGSPNGIVSIGDDSTLDADQRAAAVVAVFGSARSEGTVDQAVVAVFGDVHATGTVGNAVVAVFGDVYVNNRVRDAVVAVLGNVELGPEADVGEVVVIGGTLERAETAVVRGGVQRILTTDLSGLRFLRPWTRHALLLGRPLALEPGLGWAWGFAFAFLALYFVLALLFRDGVDRCVQTLETRPGQTVLAAILTTLLTPVLIVVLLVSVLGIAAVPFVMLAIIGASLFGKAVVLAWIGRRCTKLFPDTPLAHTAIAVLIGGLIVMALYLVPFIGFVLFNALGILGLGVVVYTLLLSLQGSRRGRATATPSPPPASTPPRSAAMEAPTSRFAEAAGEVSEPVSSADSPSSTDSASNAGTAASAGTSTAEPPPASPGRKPEALHVSDADAAALPRATFWIRMAALAIDAVMIGIVVGMLNQDSDWWLLLLGTYGAVMWKLKGTTIGGVVFGLKVVRRDGRPIDWATAIVRALSCFLSLFVAGLGFIWILFDDERQGWHDKIAGTVVVTMPKGVSLL
jgi:uncharacterized RDD family membrane protein YckC